MATKKFIIEVEEGETQCEDCPFDGCKCKTDLIPDCNKYDLSMMTIKELEEEK